MAEVTRSDVNEEPSVGTIVRDRNGDPWIRRGDGPVWLSIDNHYRNWEMLNHDYGPIEVASFPVADVLTWTEAT